jgi:MFS transporter, MFS domain-containing protein family, molybdate-anion transporter
MYALLRDDKNLDESTVARLFVTTYIAAALSALVTGFLADRFGRRLACLAFCLLHSLSSLTIISNNLVLLFVGRALAGVGLILLWTVFESWMVTEFRARGLDQNPTISLSKMLGLMTKASCLTAILGGVVGHCIVWALRSRIDLYIAAVVSGVALMLSSH